MSYQNIITVLTADLNITELVLLCFLYQNQSRGFCPYNVAKVKPRTDVAILMSICCCVAVMCDNGQVYDSCGPPTEPSCDNLYTGHTPAVSRSLTVEGCYCPPGTVRNGKLAHYRYLLTITSTYERM